MRITSTNRVLLCWLVGLVAGGCSAANLTSNDSGRASENPGATPDDLGFGQSDASADAGLRLLGSRLCAVAEGEGQCFPDDEGPLDGENCRPLPDAGADGAAQESPAEGEPPSAPPHACRVIVQDQGSGDRAPSCKTGNTDGRDGISCQRGEDCAPGFDCVDGEKGAVCRRYCCSGSCEGQTSKNGGPTFCDVQKPVDANTLLAPFCMPIKTCELLVDGACDDRETCAIVNEAGDTGCVAKGSAKAGDACDEEHCAAGLTCLGSTNNRRCYQLCKTDGSSCGTGQTCKTGAVFQDTSIGVCKEGMP